ncbi:restriction endonuclease subunit S [Legionella pneumophila serogroup 1]|uniref:restriction endonuclease subunit S n=1 Tax=Legionella pneumophila TaxID=446 RepID=UPI0007706DC1|nr:restriction endonuclease subunit S [Legionella pneumophila]CZG51344.1 Type I restriction enzyme EcoKI specificity protein [Legionella pneumophila]CZG65536.1 Type I restriction enzyme EcoKI specificity protein [Legionella pneumophila]HCE5375039.1 restriction endonuclease subunit S [Legionella pneumophila]HCE5464076.1 restriction endonuclease subunit S [Legionella pneumophila]HCE5563789.1 restriction endonuclease subunit S [Legionella pneumophila]
MNIDTTLGEIAFITTGKLDANAQDDNGKYPFFTCGEENLSINTVAFDTEAVLLAGNGNFSVKYYNGKFNAYQRTYVISPNHIDGKWLYYLVAHHIAKITTGARGSTIKYLRIGDISECAVKLVPLEHQKRIVAKIEELFSELDNGIAALKTAREQLKVYRQAILKHAFEGKLTAKWREENPDKLETPEQLLHRIQQKRDVRYQQQLEEWKTTSNKGKKPSKPKSPIQLSILNSDLPHGWFMVSLDWLLTTEKKPMTTGPFGTALKKSEHQPCGVPVLGIENIGKGKFIHGNKIFVDETKAKELLPFKIHPGEIVISRSGTVGEICEVPGDVTNALISTNLLRVSLDSSVILSPFFVLMFQGGEVKLQVKGLCKGSSREFLNQSILSSIRYPICGLEEQKVLLERLETKFSIIEQQEKEIDELLNKSEILRQSILKIAFSGHLVPQASHDESASELLERIKAEKEQQKQPANKSAIKRSRKKVSSEA